MNGVVEAAYLLEEPDVAARAYELLRPHAHLPMIGSLGITCFGSVQHALGVAALTSRQLDLAIEHLTAAVQHNLALAHWPALVASRQRLAQAHTLRGSPGDADAAHRELDAATTEAASAGLPVPDYPVPTPTPAPAPAVAEIQRVGRKWRLTLRGRGVLVEDSIGMVHLAVLIANPRQEIQAADLVAGLAGLSGTSGEAGRRSASLTRKRSPSTGAGEAAGHRDRRAGTRPGPPGQGRTRLAGRPALQRGRARRPDQGLPRPARARRVAVGKAIRRALARITEADGVIGEHLRQTVHTGVRCSYWPG